MTRLGNPSIGRPALGFAMLVSFDLWVLLSVAALLAWQAVHP